MNTLRSLLRWISLHRFLSASALLVLAAGTVYVRGVVANSRGVLSEPVERGPIVESVYGIGTVMALHSYQIKSGVTSTIDEIYIKEGAAVRKGERLIKIDDVLYRAPFDGTVTSLPFQAGENIFANTSVLTIVDLRERYVVVSLEQQGALRVKRGLVAHLSFDSQRDKGYAGVVESVYSNETGFLARIEVAGLPDNVLPGMTCDVAIAIESHERSLLVPVAGLEEGKFLWVKRERGLAERVEAKVGIVDKAAAEIVSGNVREGDRILIRKQP
jgi:macrolide-specific efflux system membrane fusion protein